MAREGLKVTAIDSSQGMLQLFKRKLSDEPRHGRDNIQIEVQSMHGFALNERFKAVICCDAFYRNLTPQHQRSCLAEVHRHLQQDERFLSNIYNNPNRAFLGWFNTPEAATLHKRAEYSLSRGTHTLTIYEALNHGPQDQIINTKLHFVVAD